MRVFRGIGMMLMLMAMLGRPAWADVTIEMIADVGTVVPGNGGLFTVIDIASQDNGNVAFSANSGDVIGVYAKMAGTLFRIADTTMAAPGGSERFTAFGSVSINQGRIVFSADTAPVAGAARVGGGTFEGIYLWADGQISKIAGLDTTPPGEGEGVVIGSYLHAPEISGGTIMFTAHLNNEKYVLYKYRDGMPLEKVVDSGTLVPGRSTTFARIVNGGIDNENVAFHGTDSEGEQGIYAVIGGQLERIADNNTTFPGSTPRITSFYQRPDIRGGNVAVPSSSGVYARLGGTLVRIADRETIAPGTNKTLEDFIGVVAMDEDGTVAFAARTADEHHGVYYGNGTELRVAADSTGKFNGRDSYTMHIRVTSFDRGRLAFLVYYTHDPLEFPTPLGLYLARGATFNPIGSSISSSQNYWIAGEGAYQTIKYNYSTSLLELTPYDLSPASISGILGTDCWSGVFLYDYTSARFSESIYQVHYEPDR